MVVYRTLNAEAVKTAILQWSGLYEADDGRKFQGCTVSGTPKQLIDGGGWKNVSHLDEHDFRAMGLEIVWARYVGGARPKRFCQVIVAKWEQVRKEA